MVLERNAHMIVRSEGFVATGALARPRSEAFFDAVFAEDMAAGLEGGVLEILPANGTVCNHLSIIMSRERLSRPKSTYSECCFLAALVC